MERLTLEIVGADREFLTKALHEVIAYLELNVNTGTVRIYENQYQWTLIREPATMPTASPSDQQEGKP